MKNIKISMFILALMLMMNAIKAQTINWGCLNRNDNHILNVNAGLEYGTVFGVGYGYQIKNKLFPLFANVEYSFASGENIFDDMKTKVGLQVRWVDFHNFQFSTRLHGVIRRYENDNIRLVDFGSDLTGVLGYYRKTWFLAAEVGFDKAIITHFKHSDAYHEQYPGALNGWFGPTTGGNFYYGVQAGFSFGKNDVYIKAGKTLTQDFKTTPTVPIYGQLGYNVRL
ncbi:MAG: hypothetical protein IPP15_01545 [Saprospiraceae bacterium]|uniref:Outer membrane protein beta-barrel domain-containing protein n=1 Tax=Candidatus Opimibacter skivensis TaxID=2982028 RepID=A0A9D7SRS9_9BACT|nr:hypothetical protein [Candidatus Opimibacter skivensis]